MNLLLFPSAKPLLSAAAAPVIAAASTAVAVAGCIVAAGSFLVGASLFCEGANDVQLGIQGYSEEEVPSTDGWGALRMTGQRMEIMQGCMSAAMLVLTGAELLTAVPGLLSYGTYLLNEQISKMPPIWPSITEGITGMSGGAATWDNPVLFEECKDLTTLEKCLNNFVQFINEISPMSRKSK